MNIVNQQLGSIEKIYGKFNSIGLVRVINEFKKREGNSSIDHNDFMQTVKEYNKVAKSIGVNEIDNFYGNINGIKQKCYLLSECQAKMFMSRESYAIQIMVEDYINQS